MAPKPQVVESRFDWRGGLNTSQNPDTLNINELVKAENVRLTTAYGALAKRTGSRRMHLTAITGGAVRGVFQWDDPVNGKSLVACTATVFAHKETDFGEFTEIAFGASIGAGPVSFAVFRDTAANGTLVLYIGTTNGLLFTWDGTSLTDITGVSGAPQAQLVRAYHTRVFAVDERFLKQLQWSDIGSGTVWNGTPPSGGGVNLIDTLSGEGIIAMEQLGSSLAIATEESIIRFTGYSSEDIQIQQDTEGISASHGALGPNLFRRFEDFVAMLTDRGPYLVTESGIEAMGVKVEPEFDDTDRIQVATTWSSIYHRGRREFWFVVRRSVDSGAKSIYVYNARLQSWTGPWVYTFEIFDVARFEDSNFDEFVVAACDDGFVRHMDIGALDDVLASGSGGSAYTMDIELAPIFAEPGPGQEKLWSRMKLQADLPALSALNMQHASDSQSFTAEAVTGVANGVQSYSIHFRSQGDRLRIRFTDASSEIPIINGFQLLGHNMLRIN